MYALPPDPFISAAAGPGVSACGVKCNRRFYLKVEMKCLLFNRELANVSARRHLDVDIRKEGGRPAFLNFGMRNSPSCIPDSSKPLPSPSPKIRGRRPAASRPYSLPGFRYQPKTEKRGTSTVTGVTACLSEAQKCPSGEVPLAFVPVETPGGHSFNKK